MHPIRPSVAVLATLALALGAISPVVLAQEDAAGHPLVGAWFLDATPGDPADPLDAVVFNEGGTVSNPANGAVGAWEPSAAQSADLTVAVPVPDPQSGVVAGFVTLRASVEVAEDGQSFSGTYTVEPPGAMSEAFGITPGELGPAEVTGQRIEVEPMGEPVGPVPDFFPIRPGGAPPTAPDASPMEPEPSPAA